MTDCRTLNATPPMKRAFNPIVAAAMLLLSLAAPVAAGPLEDAIAAVQMGDYATAMRLLRPLADQGRPDAQNNLGIMYYFGLHLMTFWRLIASRKLKAASSRWRLSFRMAHSAADTASARDRAARDFVAAGLAALVMAPASRSAMR
jgi:TPR repeat protein